MRDEQSGRATVFRRQILAVEADRDHACPSMRSSNGRFVVYPP
jgi:hypothetical protein